MMLAALGLIASLLISGVPADQQMVLDVPYRNQLDGSRYAGANCGPTSLDMVLAYYGVNASLWDVRVRAMKAQDSWTDYSDDYGVFVHYLATTAESYGLRTQGLWNRADGHVDSLHQWQASELRRALRDGHPVIVETGYRYLPGHGASRTTLDHYVVVHGLAGDQFVYSDPMDNPGGGPDLVISESDLLTAMSHAKQPRAGFAVYRPAA
jgi:uncharacterized protein YvpB